MKQEFRLDLRGPTKIWSTSPRRRLVTIGVVGLVASLLLLFSQASGSIGTGGLSGISSNQGGTFADSQFMIVAASPFDNGTILYHIAGSGKVTGVLNGSYTFTGILEESRDGQVSYDLNDIFAANVNGKSGTLAIKEDGKGSVTTRNFTSVFSIVNSTNELQGLRGQGTLTGKQNPLTLQTWGTYVMTYMFPQSQDQNRQQGQNSATGNQAQNGKSQNTPSSALKEQNWNSASTQTHWTVHGHRDRNQESSTNNSSTTTSTNSTSTSSTQPSPKGHYKAH